VGRPLPGLSVDIRNHIPLARGLGSSAAAIIGSLVAANALLGYPLSQLDLLQLADRLEGHADNVVPALYGGITLAYRVGEQAHFFRIEPPPELGVVVAVPDYRSRTAEARRVLPGQVAMRDACDNMSRLGLLVGSLLTGKLELVEQAMQDRLHQPYRLPLFPGTGAAIQAARQAGALGAALSGAGPTAVAFCLGSDKGHQIGQAMLAAFQEAKVTAQYHVVDIDLEGARVRVAS
jgi:homoserine kinase